MTPTAPRQPSGRPWPIYGHDWAVDLLRHSLRAPSGARHAYLFTGSRHIGKTTLARFLAQTLLCTAQSDTACGECRACQLMASGNHSDFRLVQPVDRDGRVDRVNGLLRAEQAATIIRDVALKPVEGRYKILLIQDFQHAHVSFANKLLKTLEEPPDHAILLLTADDRSNLLPTIVSRCQVLPLRPLDTPTIRTALVERFGAPEQTADLLARLANGRLGWAADEAGESSFLAARSEAIERLQTLIAADRTSRLAFSERMAGQRNSATLFQLLELWATWWRDVMLIQAGCGDQCANVDCQAQLQHQAQAVAPGVVQRYLALLRRIDGYLHHTVNVRLALDVLLLQLPHVPNPR